MYCDNCGNKREVGQKFCTNCGASVHEGFQETPSVVTDEKWWYRLLKVAYVFLYIPLPLILWLVWTENSTTYSYYGGYQDTSGQALWYSVLTLAIYMVVVRLIKISCLYVAIGQKPLWGKEFKRIF